MLRPADLLLVHHISQQSSLAGAARELGLTPSAVTQQVARLERAVGAPVVERGARGARLTALGHRLAEEGARIGAAMTRSASVIDEHLLTVAGRLRVGSLASAVVPIASEALAHLRMRHPGADLSVVEIGSDTGIESVSNGELDVVVVVDYGQVEAIDGIRRHHLVDDPWIAVIPERHPLARRRRRTVDLLEIADDPWVSGTAGRPHRVQQDMVASEVGVRPRVAFETESYEFAQAMVSAGTAVAVVPRLAWRRLPGTVALSVQGSPTREIVAVVPSHAGHLRLLPTMLSALRQTAAETRRHAALHT